MSGVGGRCPARAGGAILGGVAPELSVVCRSCGSEVSPYVTECPYCGQRLRKRAPKLEREGDEIRVHESRREKRKRERRERAARRREGFELNLAVRPYATGVTLLIGAILIVLGGAVPLGLHEIGAVVGPVGDQPWRYLTAPFVYDDVGYFAIVGLAIGVLGSAVERRLGTLATATMIVATGALGMLAAGAVYAAGLGDVLLAAGGNGIALGLLGALFVFWQTEAAAGGEEPDIPAIVVVAIVLLLLPLFERTADPIAGVAGAVVGLGMGALAARRMR